VTLSLIYKGFNYVADVNGSYADADSLPTMIADTASNAVALTQDWGINAVTSKVYNDSGQTETNANITATATEAENAGLSVMFRPLIDFTADATTAMLKSPNPPAGDGHQYADGDWRAYYLPANITAFFNSYQTMIVSAAQEAQSAHAQIFDIGTEIDQLTGPQYATQWNQIITAVKAVYTGKLTYSAIGDDNLSPWQPSWGGQAPAGTGDITTQVNFWGQMDYIGIDEYDPISNKSNPTLQDLIDGWEKPPVNAGATSVTYQSTGGLSLIQYYENVSAALNKPLLFTEIGYNSAPDAASQPFGTSSGTYDPALQSLLYQAFITAWQAQGNTSLQGVYIWDWEPDPSKVGAGGNPSWTPQGNTGALQVVDAAFKSSSGPVVVVAETNVAGVGGVGGSPTAARGTAGIGGTGALAGDSDTNSLALSISAIGGGGAPGTFFNTTFGSLQLKADGSYTYFPTASKLVGQPTGAPVPDTISFTVSDGAATATSSLTISDYRNPTAVSETGSTSAGGTASRTAGTAGTGALAGDSDPDGAPLSAAVLNLLLVGNPNVGNYGTLTLNPDGSYSYAANSAAVLAPAFAADGGAPLQDSFSIAVMGGVGTYSVATLTITVDQGLPPPADFYGAGKSDIVWQNTNSDVVLWQMNGTAIVGGGEIANPGPAWHYLGTGDFNGDGKSDIVWQNNNSDVVLWQMNGTAIVGGGEIANPGPAGHYLGTGDFNGDGKSDIVWQNTNSDVVLWQMNGTAIAGGGEIANPGPAWHYLGLGDFYGDGKSDIVWQNNNSDVVLWQMDGTKIVGGGEIANPGPAWHYLGLGDFYGDGKSDIVWQNTNSDVVLWQMDGTKIVGGGEIANPGPAWNYLPPTGGSSSSQTSSQSGAGSASPQTDLTASLSSDIIVPDGNANLTALSTPEVFDFSSWSFGRDTIAGFDPTQDAVSLSSGLANSFTTVQADMSPVGGGTLITFDSSRSLTLDGVAPGSLGATNFRFV